MTRQELEPWQLRSARFEVVEERLALSADPAAAIVLHGALVSAEHDLATYEHHALDLEALSGLLPQLGSVHNTTGVNNVHDNYGFDGAGQTVAVIDSGIAWDHYNLGRGYGANSRVVGGWDFAENDANPYDDAPAGFHGTHVAGIIGSDHATHTGVAPEADLVALRVFNDSGQGNFAWVESALQWVIAHHDDFENPITTVNMSLGVPSMNGTSIPNWTTLEDELRTLNQMGIFIAVSAGNDFMQFNAQGLSYPAVSQYVVPVSSANDAGTAMSNFSQRDDRVLVAPGETITSTVPDAFFSFNGVANDWASASGTSMASPYVAGASVLLREAFWSIGVTNVNQDMIYDVLFDTADLIYDPITAASYHFIDVDAAIASIIGSGGGGSQTPPPAPPPPTPPPTDSDATGNTSQTAVQVGTANHGSQFFGRISNAADNDYYRFTAGATGRMTLTAYPASGLATTWRGVPTSAHVQGQTVVFDVVAGQSYVVGLGHSSGTGDYGVQVLLEAAATNIGAVDYRQLTDTNIAGERWYSVTASRAGYFTVVANSPGMQNVDVQIYSASRQFLGDGVNQAGYARADATVSADQQLLVRVVGSSNDTDLTFANLVNVNGSHVEVNGSWQNDRFYFTVGATHQISVNDIAYSLPNAIRTVNIQGGAGSDNITFAGSVANESLDLGVGWSAYYAQNLLVTTGLTEVQLIYSGGGFDNVRLHDSAGDDTLATREFYTELTGSICYSLAYGFRDVIAIGNTGGYDRAIMYDSAGDDTFVAQQNSAQMRSTYVTHNVQGFEAVTAIAAGGADRATLIDSAGNDTLTARRNSMQLDGPGYQIVANNFDNVTVNANGGYDSAVFFDVAAPNTWHYRANQLALLRGTGFYNLANRFENVVAYATVTQSFGAPVAVEATESPNSFALPVGQEINAKPASFDITFRNASPVVLQNVSRAAYFQSFDRFLSLSQLSQSPTMRRGAAFAVLAHDIPVAIAEEPAGDEETPSQRDQADMSRPAEGDAAADSADASAAAEQPNTQTPAVDEVAPTTEPPSLELAAVDRLFEILSETP